MELPSERAKSGRIGLVMRRYGHFGLLFLMAFFIATGSANKSWALQRHELTPEEAQKAVGAEPKAATGAHAQPVQQPEIKTPAAGHQATPAPKPAGDPPEQGTHPQAAAPATPPAGHEAPKAASPEAPAAEGGHEIHIPEAGAEHGPALPQISPIAGVTFVETLIKLMDYELNGRFLGWRPNDIIIGQFTDDVNNYQLGVLEAVRFTTLRLKDSLTRMGDADSYDPDLEQALNLFMNRATSFWFPSAESSYSEALGHLRNFLEKLKSGRRNFYYRKDNLVLLIATYKDLLGNVNRNLISSNVSWFKTDDNFYYAKGVAHVIYEILRVARVGYQNQLASTMNGSDIMDEILHELHRAEGIDPWIILDSDLDGFFANHRANLNAPLSEVAHLLGVLSQF